MRLALAMALAFGCADGTDDGTPDVGAIDAGPGDTGSLDTGSPDAGTADASVDAGGLGPVTVDINADPPERLSELQLFRYLGEGRFEYNERVVRYELNTPLFSDYSLKERAIWVPTSTAITYDPTLEFAFPVGSAIVKTFLSADDLRAPSQVRILETRVLIRYPEGWRPFPYVWREDESDADLFLRGQTVELEFVDPFGDPQTAQYLIPQRNQCFDCHQVELSDGSEETVIIGPKARYLNRMATYDGVEINQLTYLSDQGMLTGLPPLTEVEQAFDFSTLSQTGTLALDAATIEGAARDYLDINCAHCHSPRAIRGVTSQLFLNYDNEDRFRLGVCKEPGSAGGGAGGRQYDIVPGDPDASIMWFRTATDQVGAMMPLLGRSVTDRFGADLVWGWIENMPPEDCQP